MRTAERRRLPEASMRLSFLAPPAFALALTGAALPCAAAPPDPKAAARKLADEGYELYQAGKMDEAIDAFRRADQLFHAPTLVFAQAKASARAGKLLEARALFQRVIAEKLPPNAPDEFVGAQSSAEGELTALTPRIPTIVIKVRAPDKLHFSVSIDGQRLPPSSLDKPVEQNPGQHAVLVMPETGKGTSRNVILHEGDSELVELTLTAQPPLEPQRKATPLPPAPPPPAQGNGLTTPAIVAFGAGAVGIGVGAGLGVMTLSRASDLDAQCPSHKACAPSLEPGFATTNLLAALSTAGFVIGGAGAAAGAILLLVPGKPGDPNKPADPPRAALSVGPGFAAVRGVF
ncbi:MAG: hypothetical protein U0359_31695 [Byssovorax sp.]